MTNNNIQGPFMRPELVGKIKYKCWEYEDEVRLCGELSSCLSEDECLGIKLPDSFDSMIRVTLGPGFDKKTNNDYLTELNIRGIECIQSVYDPTYSSFLDKI